MSVSLIQKYNIPGPRYTSYPTVPYWDQEKFSKNKWIETFKRSFKESNKSEGISIYIHLPYCESLCTFCACHKHITKKPNLQGDYVSAVLKEWNLYLGLIDETPIIKEIHLGGGTPTFFSPNNLEILIKGLFKHAIRHDDYEFSFEGHPNSTTKEHLQRLYDLGFTRVSYGVQDYNIIVQKAINRVQPFENVKRVTDWAREIGYTSVSHDLIFGLPFQTMDNVLHTIKKTKELQPDRISFYSYAHVPWVKGVGQRGFDENDLPKDEEKRALYEAGKALFAELDYVEIGMDHFSLETDTLYKGAVDKTLHRNFMGYTANKTQLMIGLGMSSISDSWYGFAQNEKSVKKYYRALEENQIPVFRGHILDKEDLVIRKHILNIMCHFETTWEDEQDQFEELDEVIKSLEEIKNDGLIEIYDNKLIVKEKARPFVRNICMAFDRRLQRNQPETKLFSMTI